MKRIFALLLALLLLAMPLVSCSKDEDGEKEKVDLAVTEQGLSFTPEGTTDVFHSEYHNSDEVMIIGYEGADVEHAITIPAEIDGRPVTKIEKDAFKSATMLTAVTLPDTVVEIDDWAFFGCVALKTVTLPNALVRIGEGTFAGCSVLSADAELVLPTTLTEIGTMAFFATGIQSIKIPVGVKELPEQAFMYCTNLTTVVWSEEGEEIGAFAFMYCATLSAINVPTTLKSVGEYAFTNCYSLPALVLPEGATVGDNAFYVSYGN